MVNSLHTSGVYPTIQEYSHTYVLSTSGRTVTNDKWAYSRRIQKFHLYILNARIRWSYLRKKKTNKKKTSRLSYKSIYLDTPGTQPRRYFGGHVVSILMAPKKCPQTKTLSLSQQKKPSLYKQSKGSLKQKQTFGPGFQTYHRGAAH